MNDPQAARLTSSDHMETEWQFDAGDLGQVTAWLESSSSIDRYEVEDKPAFVLDDVYYDTADWRIHRAGYALRIRRGGGKVEATLKGLSPRREGLSVRREITQSLDAAGPSEGLALLFSHPGPVQERLRSIGRPETIAPLAEIRTRRAPFVIRRHGAVLGEVVLDHSSLVDPPGRTHELKRVEFEAVEGRTEAAEDYALRLARDCNLVASTQSKFEWSLESCGWDPEWPKSLDPTRADKAMTQREAALAVLRRHYGAFLRHEPGVRLNEDIEHIHDMRVAARRMRAALRVFRDALTPEEAVNLRAELKSACTLLGQVRDLDVQIEQLESLKGSLLAAPPAACHPLITRLRQRNESAREELVRFLDSREFTSLVDRLGRRLRSQGRSRLPAARLPVRLAGVAILRRARKRVVRLGSSIRVESPPADYHELRVRCKRLRYSLEFLEPVYGSAARDLIEVLVELQDNLGSHQDAQVAIAVLRELARDDFPPATLLAIGELIQIYAAQAVRLREQFDSLFAPLRGKKWRALRRVLRKEVKEAAAEQVRNLTRKSTHASMSNRGATIAPLSPPQAELSPMERNKERREPVNGSPDRTTRHGG